MKIDIKTLLKPITAKDIMTYDCCSKRTAYRRLNRLKSKYKVNQVKLHHYLKDDQFSYTTMTLEELKNYLFLN